MKQELFGIPTIRMVEEKVINLSDVFIKRPTDYEININKVSDYRAFIFTFTNGYSTAFSFRAPTTQKEVIEALRMMANRIEEESK